jgi:antirestriction protein ArdC
VVPPVLAYWAKVIEKFQAGDLSPITPAVTFELGPEAPARLWSLGNKVLAFAQTGTLDCRGYRQWQAAGRQVKKGSHSAYILSPVTVKKEKDAGEEYRQCIGFKATPVFSIAGTDGDPLPEYVPKKLPPLAEMAHSLGIDVSYQPLPPNRLGDYSPARDAIRLCAHDEAVFFHELAHAAHARVETLQGGQDTRQETIAEFTSCVLMELYGLRDHTGNAWQYIKSYADDPLTAITKALSTMEAVLAVLLPA